MGRAKRKLELLSNQRDRRQTFERRMEGLKKKAHELKTLCNVELCLIVDNGPKIEELQIWPSDPDLINKLITSHKNQPADDPRTSVNLSTFFKAQNQKIGREIIELKEKNKTDMYPTWDDRYNVLSKEQLEEFGGLLGQKLQMLTTRIESLRSNSGSSNFFHEPIPPRDSDYFQKQFAEKNDLYVPQPFFCKQPETGNFYDSYKQAAMTCDNSFFNESEALKDSGYFQKQTAAQNELCFPRPNSCKQPKTGNSIASSEQGACLENQFYAENPVAKISFENDSSYTQLEELYSSDFLSGFLDWPISDNFDLLTPHTECYFDLDKRIVSPYSQESISENDSLRRNLSAELDEFLSSR